jgi:hypothetical protein
MNTIDIAVYSLLAIVAAYPAIRSAVTKALPKITAPTLSVAGKPATEDEWTQRWSALLIDLVGELEAKGDKPAASLGRELIWLIIGGEKQGGKK